MAVIFAQEDLSLQMVLASFRLEDENYRLFNLHSTDKHSISHMIRSIQLLKYRPLKNGIWRSLCGRDAKRDLSSFVMTPNATGLYI